MTKECHLTLEELLQPLPPAAPTPLPEPPPPPKQPVEIPGTKIKLVPTDQIETELAKLPKDNHNAFRGHDTGEGGGRRIH